MQQPTFFSKTKKVFSSSGKEKKLSGETKRELSEDNFGFIG